MSEIRMKNGIESTKISEIPPEPLGTNKVMIGVINPSRNKIKYCLLSIIGNIFSNLFLQRFIYVR